MLCNDVQYWAGICDSAMMYIDVLFRAICSVCASNGGQCCAMLCDAVQAARSGQRMVGNVVQCCAIIQCRKLQLCNAVQCWICSTYCAMMCNASCALQCCCAMLCNANAVQCSPGLPLPPFPPTVRMLPIPQLWGSGYRRRPQGDCPAGRCPAGSEKDCNPWFGLDCNN